MSPPETDKAGAGVQARPRVLVVDDEWSLLERIKGALRDQYHVEAISQADKAAELMERKPFDVVFTDLRLPGHNGLSLVEGLQARFPETQYVLMTAFSDIEDAISAMRLGVADYLRKPFTMGEVRLALERCLERRRLKREVASLKAGGGSTFGDIVSASPTMNEVRRLADTVAPTDVTVLISGETGTGKGLMAKALHNSSSRRDRPFVEINCAAIPTNLIESELFGHERGSFTGAVSRKIGRVEMAEGGTLLLDEVGEMPLDMQAKLLRFLQSFAFERVGGTKELHADVRVVAATNRDLEEEVKAGHFREDLFYRLHVIQLHLPPLRDRREDILVLARHFLQRFNIKYGKNIGDFTPRVETLLTSHDWPGNVRELEHTIERALILCQGEVISQLSTVPVPGASGQRLRDDQPAPLATEAEPPPDCADLELADYLNQCERRYLTHHLRQCKGRVGQTAKMAGLNPKTLYLKMNRHGLTKEDFRPGGGGD